MNIIKKLEIKKCGKIVWANHGAQLPKWDHISHPKSIAEKNIGVYFLAYA